MLENRFSVISLYSVSDYFLQARAGQNYITRSFNYSFYLPFSDCNLGYFSRARVQQKNLKKVSETTQ